jgi:hypothetical protein
MVAIAVVPAPPVWPPALEKTPASPLKIAPPAPAPPTTPVSGWPPPEVDIPRAEAPAVDEPAFVPKPEPELLQPKKRAGMIPAASVKARFNGQRTLAS